MTACVECGNAKSCWGHDDRNPLGHLYHATGDPLVSPGPRSFDALTGPRECLTVRIVMLPSGTYQATIAEAPGRVVTGRSASELLRTLGEAMQAAEERRAGSVYDDAGQDVLPLFRDFIVWRPAGVVVHRPSRGKLEYKWWIRSAEKQVTFADVFRRDLELDAVARERLGSDSAWEMALLTEQIRGVLTASEKALRAKLAMRKCPPVGAGDATLRGSVNDG